jgi:hypothetical protein
MDTTNEPNHSHLPLIFLWVGVGIFVSLIILLSFIFFSNSTKPANKTSPNLLKLTLISPAKNTATSSKTITVAGTTGIKSVVTISLGGQSKIISTSGDSFSTKLDLAEGKNTITVVAYNSDTGESQTQTEEILYLNEDLTSL